MEPGNRNPVATSTGTTMGEGWFAEEVHRPIVVAYSSPRVAGHPIVKSFQSPSLIFTTIFFVSRFTTVRVDHLPTSGRVGVRNTSQLTFDSGTESSPRFETMVPNGFPDLEIDPSAREPIVIR